MTVSKRLSTATKSCSPLLGPKQIQAEYSLGRDVARRLCRVLPHIRLGHCGVGTRRVVHRRHLDCFLLFVSEHNLDLKQVLLETDPTVIHSWVMD